MRILRNLKKIFFGWKTSDIENMSFKEVVFKHLDQPQNYSEEEKKNAEARAKEIVQSANERMTKSADDLVNHMIWIGGGSLLLASNILVSDKLNSLTQYWLFEVSYYLFALSVLIALISFIADILNSSFLLAAQSASDEIPEGFKDLKAGMTREQLDELREKLEESFENFKACVKAGVTTIRIRNALLLIAAASFFFGMLCFLIFGATNVSYMYEKGESKIRHDETTIRSYEFHRRRF